MAADAEQQVRSKHIEHRRRKKQRRHCGMISITADSQFTALINKDTRTVYVQ